MRGLAARPPPAPALRANEGPPFASAPAFGREPVAHFIRACAALRRADFSSQGLCNALWGMGVLCHRPAAVLRAAGAGSALEAAAAAAQSQDCANALWALAVVDAAATPLARAFWRRASEMPPEAYAPQALRALHHVRAPAPAAAPHTNITPKSKSHTCVY